MNESEAFAVVRNAIRLENLGRDVAAKVTPELLAIMKQLRELIEQFPPETIARDLRYRQLLAQLPPMFRGVNDQLYEGLTGALREEAAAQVQWAGEYLAKGTAAPLPVAPINMAQLVTLADETEVLGRRLTTLFGWGDVADSPFMKTAIKHIDRVVKQGFLLGETNEEIARNLARASNATLRDTRAIARTAVMDMSQRAHERVWDANDGVIEGWVFDATLDWRVCLQCAPFDQKRAKDRDDLPQTPIHPNCVLGDTPVAAGGVIAATRAVYSGDIVTVRTESGRQFSVTAQHPVLTDRGWVRANELGNGLNLIAHRERIPSSLDLPDLNNGPTTAAQVFEAFCASPGVTTDAVPPTPMQFHGDGKAIKGDVEVVWSQRPLQLNSSAESFQAFSEFSGIGADAKLFLESGFSPTDLLFIWLNAAANGLVSLADECQALLRGECSLTQAHSFAARVRGHSCLFEPIYDNRPAAAEALGNALDALASLVSRDQIVDVQVEATHELAVYDFTTLSGIYSMDQALGHNCRCRVLPVVEDEEKRRARAYGEISEDAPANPDARVYKTPVRKDGKKYVRSVSDGPGDMTMADFLQRANPETRASVLGSKKNAERFEKLIRGTPGTRAPMTAREALMRIISNPSGKL